MKLKHLMALLCLSANAALPAQEPATQDYAVRGSQYPKLLSGQRAEFSVDMPSAKSVEVDIAGKRYPMRRADKRSPWRCVTDSLRSGFHYYFLYVDGVRVSDPSSETFYGCSVAASGLEVPYPAGDNRFQLSQVPHGEVAQLRYFSNTCNAWRRMFVYLPPSYRTDYQRSFPVLYLQHGGGEDERGWCAQGRTDIMLDNLIAQGKAAEMIIAMCDGNVPNWDFANELINECIPLVERSYRVAPGAENRALAGLSMGGIQTLNVSIEHPELFNYVGVFSSGWWAGAEPSKIMRMDAERYYSLLSARPDYFNAQFKEFYITMGAKEDIAYNNCQIMMRRFSDIGIRYSYEEFAGGHTWPVWRESLWQFAQRIFRHGTFRASANPILRDAFTADPAPLVDGDTLYLYVGHDEYDEAKPDEGKYGFNITEWLCYSTADMQTWRSHGAVLRPADFSWAVGEAWASQVVKHGGKYYYFVSTQEGGANAGKSIGVAVGDTPTGPFRDAIGKPLITDKMTDNGARGWWNDIDPTVLIDETGAYLCWGNGTCFMAKLKPSLTEIDGDIKVIDVPNYIEGPWLHKREGIYYLTYASSSPGTHNETISYCTAPSADGPWTFRGEIMGEAYRSFTIHPGIEQFKGKWYLFYHDGSLTLRGQNGTLGRRSVCVEEMHYNADGTIQPVKQTR